MTEKPKELGLAKYDAMCLAIAECHRVDEAKEIRAKARALEVYAAQANNRDAEGLAAGIRLRAERRAGELLREMRQNGARQGQGGDQKTKLPEGTLIPATLADLGVSKKQSAEWQRLAEIPKPEFEKILSSSVGPATTDGVLNAHYGAPEQPVVRMQLEVLNAWARMRDFERPDYAEGSKLLDKDPLELMPKMTDPMRRDVLRLAPQIAVWLRRFAP